MIIWIEYRQHYFVKFVNKSFESTLGTKGFFAILLLQNPTQNECVE